MKTRILAITTAVAVATAAAISPASAAEDYSNNDGFVPGEPGSTLTGSSVLDTAGITLAFIALLKLVADNVPPLRQAIDEAAASVGLQSSSGLDFNLERLARTNGQVELADQIAALTTQSS